MNVNDIRDIRISDYNYPLPDERIAKHPLAQREQCRLLCWRDGAITDHRFYEVPSLLPPQAMLVYNNTRVINARLRFRKDTGSLIEIFCLEPCEPHDYELVFQTTHTCTWQCLVGNSKRWKQGELRQQILVDGQNITLTATRGEQLTGAWAITFTWDGEGVTFASVLEAVENPFSVALRLLPPGGDAAGELIWRTSKKRWSSDADSLTVHMPKEFLLCLKE